MNTKTAKSHYEELIVDRQTYLDRARECAKLTIPTLLRPEASGSHTNYPTPHQGVGARCVNNLASKLLLSLFPPNAPFFSMKVDDFQAEQLGEQRSKVDEQLAKYERSVMQAVEASGDRSAHFEAKKHLIVAGNVLLYLPKDKGTRVFHMDRYVILRDGEGNMLKVIVKEEMHYETLPADVQATILLKNPEFKPESNMEPIEVYTVFRREGKTIKSHQEILDIEIDGSQGSWPVDQSPVLPLRWTRIDGEHWGRSYVEEYLGDFISLEGLSKALLEAAAASARLIILVNPNGNTRVKDITEAPNGGAVSGRAEDLEAFQVNKHADLSVAKGQIAEITERLAYAFLMNSAVQRQGERVTAEEVRYMAGELEDALGGVYSILSQEYQLPYVNRVIARLTKAKKLPQLPKEVATPTIVTGLEALGRGHDLSRYDLFLKALQPLGPEVVAQEMNVSDYITRIGTSLGIDLSGLVKTPEQKQEEAAKAQGEAQQGQMLDMAKGAIPAIAKEGAAALSKET